MPRTAEWVGDQSYECDTKLMAITQLLCVANVPALTHANQRQKENHNRRIVTETKCWTMKETKILRRECILSEWELRKKKPKLWPTRSTQNPESRGSNGGTRKKEEKKNTTSGMVRAKEPWFSLSIFLTCFCSFCLFARLCCACVCLVDLDEALAL